MDSRSQVEELPRDVISGADGVRGGGCVWFPAEMSREGSRGDRVGVASAMGVGGTVEGVDVALEAVDDCCWSSRTHVGAGAASGAGGGRRPKNEFDASCCQDDPLLSIISSNQLQSMSSLLSSKLLEQRNNRYGAKLVKWLGY